MDYMDKAMIEEDHISSVWKGVSGFGGGGGGVQVCKEE